MNRKLSTCVLGCLVSFWLVGCESGDAFEPSACGTDEAICADNGNGSEVADRATSIGLYQAEKYTSQNGCTVATNNAGYTGSGFVDYGGNGTWIELNNLYVATAGNYTLKFRYATAANSRQCAILINGANVGNVPFSATGSWTNWGTASLTKPLRAGANTIRILANTSSGGPNLDSLEILGEVVDNCPSDPNKTEPGQCGCGVPEGSCATCKSTLSANERLSAGQYRCSASGRYKFGMSSGGNLALLDGTKSLWSASTCCGAAYVIMQGDGNLVVYENSSAKWSSKTAGKAGASLTVENNGTAVIRYNGSIIWSVGTAVVEDKCPNDPNKTDPGLCGCGIPEGTCNNQPSPWKFVVVGDSRGDNNGVNTSVLSSLVKAIIAEKAEFVLFPGDLTGSGTQSQFNTWMQTVKPLYDAKIGVYAVRGNHDDSSLSAWNNTFSGSYQFPQNGPSNEKNLTYSRVHKNVFFIAMDNYASSSGINQSWLNGQLAANTQPHVFVFGHEPAFAADHSDTLDDNSSARNTFWQSLKNAGGRAYFCGHDHFYDHARIGDGGSTSDDLHQFIIGTAGAPLYNFGGSYQGNNSSYTPAQQHFEMQYGYIVVLVDGLNIELTFKKRSGTSYVDADWLDYTAK